MSPSLWNRSFVLWLLGTAQSHFGSALAGIALSFLVLHQTGSAQSMALTLACTVLPNLLMPLAGTLVDRWPLKVPLIGADLVRGVLQLTVGGLAVVWGEVPLWLVNAAAVLTGLAGLFAGPATSAAVAALVAPAYLAQANGLLGSVGRGAWLLGTLAGGWIVTRWSPPVAIVADGLSFLGMAVLLTWVTLPGRPADQETPSKFWAEVRAGVQVMGRSRLLMLAPLIALLLNASLAPVTAILPKLFDTLGASATGYGTFLALESAGLLTAGLLIVKFGGRVSSGRLIGAGLLLTAGTYAALWHWPLTSMLLPGAVLLGFGFGLINVPFQTLIHQRVPQAYLGRVFSVLGMVSSIGMPLSLLLVSPWLDLLPMALWFGLAALAQGLGGLAWLWGLRTERGKHTGVIPRSSV
ncbi:MFS transporter [Deinococcus sp. Arct2-2]|uniref:MFS transporter n=1 Tax=Deinococcus sp. Arct2-2 TaxID=2568653 RepID=UPI0010A3E146|nr:MFS transporter [Deinococcus sp. Arct2-2]THF68964.1 MFS transporter [Deinococcus sp. Arct2-2]